MTAKGGPSVRREEALRILAEHRAEIEALSSPEP